MTLKDDRIETALEVIKTLQKETGITLTQLANDIGISIGYLSGALNGRTKLPEHSYTTYKVKAFVKKLKMKNPCQPEPETIKKP